ncbi:MAG: gamma-glutamylcyclotransferase family protein [Actinomycetota bacterium]
MSETGLPLFVYGTLRPGEAAAPLLLGVVERVEPATARGRHLQVSESYPAVIFDETGDVTGELMWLRADREEEVLARLDTYEGVPHLFRRVRITVTCGSDELDAYAYEWTGDSPAS